MKKIISDTFGEIERIEAPFTMTYGRLTLTEAQQLAALTQYGTEGLPIAGVPLGAFNDLLELTDVASISTLYSFIAENLASWIANKPTIDGETIIYDPYC